MNGYSVVRHPLSRTTCPGHGPALDGQPALAIDDAPGAAITTWNGGGNFVYSFGSSWHGGYVGTNVSLDLDYAP